MPGCGQYLWMEGSHWFDHFALVRGMESEDIR